MVFMSLAVILKGSSLGAETVVRVVDPGGTGIADVVLLVNPGASYKSVALVTDAHGKATVPNLGCKVCLVTAMDPRMGFSDKTTEFQAGARSLTMVLGIRPVIDAVPLGTMKVRIKVQGTDGMPLRHQTVVFRDAVGSMRNNCFYTLSTDSKGMITRWISPGDYVLASLVDGKFLEAPLHFETKIQRECSERAGDCLIAKAVTFRPLWSMPGKSIAVTLAAPKNIR